MTSLAFATEAQLGFDLSIERVVGRKTEYNVCCCDKWYRILDDISDFKAAWILGRATRVWKVRELKDRSVDSTVVGDILVMKDVWVDEDARSEKEILDDIISKINLVNPITTVDRSLVFNHFIEIVADVLVETTNSLGLQEGDCTSSIFQGALPSLEYNALPVSRSLAIAVNAQDAIVLQGAGSEGNETSHLKSLRFKGSTAKQHRRILYAECGEPLDKVVSNHRNFFVSLQDATKGRVYLC